MFSLIGAEIDSAFLGFVGAAIARLMGYLTPMALTAVTLWIFLYGVAVKRGEVNEPIAVFAKKMVINVLIIGLATTAGVYHHYVVDTFNDLSLGAIKLFAIPGSGVDSAASAWGALDTFTDQASELLNRLWDETSWTLDMPAGLFAIFLFAVGDAVFIIAAFFVLLITGTIGKFLLVIGPAFILLALFESTRKFTHNWIGALAGVVMIGAIAFFTLGLSLSINSRVVAAATAGLGSINLLKQGLVYMVAFAGLGVLVWQSPGLASGLVGGAPMQMGVSMATQVLTMLRVGRGGGGAPNTPPGNEMRHGPSLGYRLGDAVGKATGTQYLYQRVAARGRG